MELEFGARHLNFSPHCCLFCSVTSMAAGMKKLKRACSDETLTSFCEPLGMDMIDPPGRGDPAQPVVLPSAEKTLPVAGFEPHTHTLLCCCRVHPPSDTFPRLYDRVVGSPQVLLEEDFEICLLDTNNR